MSIYDAVNRRNKGGTGTASGSSSLGKKISEANKQKKERDRVRDAASFDLGSFGSDLASTSKSLYDYSSTWHSPEDMANAKQGFENMYNRIGSYIDYTKKYGINNPQEFDFEGLRDVYGSVLSGWDDLTFDYGNYKNADEYNKANKEAEDRNNYLSTVSISDLQAQLDDVNKQKKEAKTQLSSADYNFKKLDNGRNKPKYGVSPEAHNEAKTAYDGAKNAYFDLEQNASTLQRDITLAKREQAKNKLTADVKRMIGNDTEAGTAIAQGKMLAESGHKKELNRSIGVPGASGSKISSSAEDANQIISFGSEEEQNAYYYLLGSGQTDKANAYAGYLKDTLNAREGRQKRKDADTYLEKLLVGVGAGFEQFGSGIEGLFNFSGEYKPTSALQYASHEIRQELTQQGRPIARLGFDVAQTGANMLPSIAASAITGNPTIGTVTMGASAGGNSYQEMINQGYSQGQAYTYGILTGVSEAALQKVMGGIGALGGTSSKIATAVGSLKNGIAKFALRWGGSMASEGLEEAAQEILAPIFKSIATGEAPENVDWGEVAYSALLGGLLGAGEGVSIGANVIGESRVGKAIKGNERINDVFDMASLSPEESQAYELYTRLADSGVTADNVSNAQLGSLASQIATDAQQTIKSKTATAEQKTSASKALSDIKVYAQKSAGAKLSKKEVKDLSAGDVTRLIGSGLESGKDTEAYKLATEYKKKLVGDGKLETKTVEASKVKLSEKEIRKLMDANASALKAETLASNPETESEQKTKALARYNAGEVLTEAEYKLLNGTETLEAAQKEVDSLSKVMDDVSAKLFTELYDGKVNQERYAEDFTRVMFYATRNYSDDYILKNSGVITPAQVSKIVSETITNNARQREASQKKAFEEMGGVFAHQADIDDSAVNYGDTPVKGKVNFNSLNMRQRNSIAFAMGLSRALGTDLVIEPDNPKYNGKFSKSTRKIYINAYAGKIDGQPFKNALIPALSHETTHRMELESPALFRELSNIVFSTLEKADGVSEADRIAQEQIRLDIESPKKSGKKHTEEEARSEIVARACEDMLSRSEKAVEMFSALTEEQQKGFVGTIRQIIAELKKAIRKLLATFKSDSYEASVLRNFEEELNEMQKLWDKMLENSVAANQVFKEQMLKGIDGKPIGPEELVANRKKQRTHRNELSVDEDVQFSMKENVEETKDLIAVHNLREDKLMKSLNLGGLPMPSIAIVRAREGHNNFGDISLVFRKETIDPKFFRSNKVYSGDAWAPTYPNIEYKVNEKALNSIEKIINSLVPRDVQRDLGGLHLDSYNVELELNRRGNMVEPYRYNYAMKYAFLKDNDINIELPTKEKPLYRFGEVSNNAVISFAHKMVEGLKTVNALLEQHSSKLMADADLINGIASVLNEEVLSTVEENTEAYKQLVENPLYKTEDINLSTVLGMLKAAREYFHSSGQINSEIDYRIAKTLIDEKVDMAKYESWLKELFADIVAKEGIRNNKDLFTSSGNRRSFEALHYEHNLENVIKAMKEEGAKGIGGFGVGNIFGASTTEYSSIDDIKADAENRLRQLPESEFQEIKKGFSDRFYELASSLPIHKDSFSAVDDAANMLIEAVLKFKTKSGIANYIRSESKGWANYSDYVVDDLIELVEDIRNMPVAYFEAKPQRAVGFDEVATAIIPDNASEELKAKLSENNIPFTEYESGNDTARLDALNSLDDVQFSDKNTESVYDLMGESERLAEENKKLAADVELLKERLKLEKTVTHGKYAKSSTLLNAASVILGKAQSKYSKVDLAKRIGDVYTYIASDPDVSAQGIFDRLYPIAEDVLAEAKVEVEVDYAIKGLLKDLKKTRISLDNAQIAEMEYRFGKDWHKRFFNKIIIAEDGIPLDSKWQEWAENIPAYFDADINSADQIGALYDLIDTLKEASERVIEYDHAEQARWLADEIYNQFWNITPYESTADKYEKKISELKSKHKQMMTELRSKRDAREKQRLEEQKTLEAMYYGRRLREKDIEKEKAVADQRLADDIHYGKIIRKIDIKNTQERDKQKLADHMYYGRLIHNLRTRRENEVAQAKELGKQKLAEHKESARRDVLLHKIYATGIELAKTIQHPTKDKHVPEFLHPFVNYVLESLDFSSKQLLGDKGTEKKYRGMPTNRDKAILPLLESLHSSLASESKIDVDQNLLIEMESSGLDYKISKIISDLQKRTDSSKLTLVHLDSESLHLISTALSDLKHIINKANDFYTLTSKHSIRNLANEEIEYLLTAPRLGQYKNGGFVDKAQAAVFFEMTNPIWFFDRLGPAGRQIFESLMKAQGKYAYLAAEIQQKADELVDKKLAKTLRKHTFKFKLKQGKDEYAEFSMSATQVMSLYLLAKQEHSRGHLFEGNGMTLTQVIASKGAAKTFGKVEDIVFTKNGEIDNRPIKNIRLTQDTFGEILAKFRKELGADADKALAIADQLQQYMATRGAELGNEVSMARFGYNAFTNPEYFPIKVTPGQVNTTDEDSGKKNSNLELAIFAKGMLKERIDGAKQSVEVADIFATFSTHMTEMAQYNAFALPILDSYKFFHYKENLESKEELSVRNSITRAYTENAWKYVTDLIKDLNGEGKSGDKSMLLDIFSNTKAAAVGARIKTALLQPTSYIRAEAVIDGKYLTKALTLSPKVLMRGVENSEKHCGIVKWKSLGYYDIGISPSMQKRIEKAETTREVLVELSMKGMAIGDTFTLGMLWNACELEIRDTRKDLAVGSKEFNEAISNRLSEVVYRTQVVDSPLTKSPMLKNKGPIKLFATFASETLVTYNLAVNTFYNYAIDKNAIGEEAAKKKHGVKIRKALTAHLLSSIAVAMLETLATEWWYDDDDEEKTLLDVFKVFLHNAGLNMTIIGQLPVLRDVVSAISGYTGNSLPTRFISNTIGAGKAWGKMFDSPDGKKFWKALGKSFGAFSDLTGIPLLNAWKEVQALFDKFGADF